MQQQSLKRDLIRFFVLTFLISWSIFGALLLFDLPDFPTVLPGIYGPTIAAIIVTSIFYGKAGVKSFLKRFLIVRFSWKYYAFLIFGFLAIGYFGLWLWSLASGQPFFFNRIGINAIISVTIFQMLIPGIGEEFGWRGFGLYRLQHLYSPLKASLILGTIHWFWHMPTFLLGQGIHNVPAIWSFLYVIPFTILFTWIFNHTKGSILASAMFHGLHGAALTIVSFLPSEQVVPINTDLLTMIGLPDGHLGPYVILVLVYWLFAVAVLAGAFGGIGTPPKFQPVPEEKDVATA